MRSYELSALAMLSAVAVVFQLLNDVIGFKTPFGMTIDLVAVPIVLALFIFGFEGSLYVAAVTALAITFISPTSWLGASMKFAGTLPLLMVCALMALAKGKSTVGRAVGAMVLTGLVSLLLFVASGSANLFAKDIGMAGELFLGLLPIGVVFVLALGIAKVWTMYGREIGPRIFADWRIFGLALVLSVIVRGVVMVIANYYYAGPLFFGMSSGKLIELVPWWLIFGFNALQSAIEGVVAWALAYRYGLAKYGS